MCKLTMLLRTVRQKLLSVYTVPLLYAFPLINTVVENRCVQPGPLDFCVCCSFRRVG